MAGEMKIIEMHLEYGVRPARLTALGTGTKFGPTSSSEFDSSVPMDSVKAQAQALGDLILEFSNSAVEPVLRPQFLVELELHIRSARTGSSMSPNSADATRKRFLKELIKQFNPNLLNNDVQDIGSAIGLALHEAESVAGELAELGLIQFLRGVGGMIAPTEEGKKAAADPHWQ